MIERLIKLTRTRYFIFETIAGLAILAAAGTLLTRGHPAFVGIEPNPFWIIVLAMALRYGRPGALFAGVLTAAVFMGLLVARGGLDAVYDDPWVLRFPFLFILVGFMVGEVKTAFLLREEYLTARIGELEGANDRLSKESGIVKEAHRELTASVATQQGTITVLNEIMGRLKTYDTDAIFSGILTSFRENLGAEECSFYVREGDLLRLFRSVGWQSYHRRPEAYPVGQGMIGIAAQELCPQSVKDVVFRRHAAEETRPELLGDSILAIPVVGLGERCFGVASIEKIPLYKFTESAVQTARVICELAAASLNSALAFRELEERQIRDAQFDCFKYHYFLARLKEEFLRASSYMIPLTAMAFRWPAIQGYAEEPRAVLLTSAIAVLKAKLRAFDVLARGPDAATPLVLLLSTTSAPQAEEMKKEFIGRFDEYGLSGALADGPIASTIALASYNPHTTLTGEDLLRALGL